jgi:hypothetical protein
MGNKAVKPVIVEETTPVVSPPPEGKIDGFKPESFFFLSKNDFELELHTPDYTDLDQLHEKLVANNLVGTGKIFHRHIICEKERFLSVKINKRWESDNTILIVDLVTRKASGYKFIGYKFEEFEIDDFNREKADELALGLGFLLQFFL